MIFLIFCLSKESLSYKSCSFKEIVIPFILLYALSIKKVNPVMFNISPEEMKKSPEARINFKLSLYMIDPIPCKMHEKIVKMDNNCGTPKTKAT